MDQTILLQQAGRSDENPDFMLEEYMSRLNQFEEMDLILGILDQVQVVIEKEGNVNNNISTNIE